MARKRKAPQNRAAEARRGDGKFAPGVSGNPGGRPREERDVVEALRLCGVELAQKLVDLGLKGNVRAIEVALDRAYGKPRDTVVFTPSSEDEDQTTSALDRMSRDDLRELCLLNEIASGSAANIFPNQQRRRLSEAELASKRVELAALRLEIVANGASPRATAKKSKGAAP